MKSANSFLIIKKSNLYICIKNIYFYTYIYIYIKMKDKDSGYNYSIL